MDINSHLKQENNIRELLHSLSNSSLDNIKIYSIFSSLGVYLLSNGEHSASIIRHRLLYTKILNCLNRAKSLQTAVVLNFISAVLYIDVQEGPTTRKALHIYAQNVIRVSGCLSAMCDLFESSMMHQDTWRALCHSLADACRGSTPNQNTCSHLVPLCVQRCARGNVDVILVLQSLLQHHKYNNQLFYINNGMAIFSRTSLQDTGCLQLLNTVIENISQESVDNIFKVNKILQELHALSILGECSPNIVQWKSIIFYSYHKVLGNHAITYKDVFRTNKSTNLELEATGACDDTGLLLQNVFREVQNMYCNKNNIETKGQKKNNYILNNDKDIFHRPAHNFIQKGSNRKNRCFKSSFTPKYKDSFVNKEDLSFSFLINMNDRNVEEEAEADVQTKDNYENVYRNSKINRTNRTNSLATECMDLKSNVAYDCDINFKPSFASTPKKHYFASNNITSTKSFQSKYSDIRRTAKRIKRIDSHANSSVLKNRSLSSKFLEAVNESCTTIIKSFKKVFDRTSQNQGKQNKANGTNTSPKDSFSSSFMNYMPMRDQFHSNAHTSNEILPEKGSNYNMSCSTCNDTLELREKMVSDRRLRETVKKLKLGINLFGCDFKKISNTFWPNEKCMTPKLLYNLYRKLIVK